MTQQNTTNPLLKIDNLIAFDKISHEHVQPAITELLKNSQQALDKVTQDDFPANWQQLSSVLDVALERLSLAWGAVEHLKSVCDTAELRKAYNNVLPVITDFLTRLKSNEKLYAKYKAIDIDTLNDEQKQALKNSLRDFVLSGVELKDENKKRFMQIQERMVECMQKFSENVLDATDNWQYYATTDELDGVPQDVQQAAKQAAQDKGKENTYLLNLKIPCYLPVMQYAKSSKLRETLYRAYNTRASDQAQEDARQYDNSGIMAEILRLRQEEAQLLGYRNFAELSLVTKMADTPEEVITFLRDLAEKSRPFAKQDVADLRDYAKQHLNIEDPQPWDWAFISEQLKEDRYKYNEQTVKQYFQAPKVLEGLFRIVENIFEVQITKDNAPTWNESVDFYKIERAGQLIGQFYLDTPARGGKRGGAWMDSVRSRWLRSDTNQLQTPIAHLVCNFADGINGKPALMTHNDVITIFHEFGHGLHHMLTKVNEADVAGINGVEWDAVELPSQFMENFCWEWDVLRNMTAHIDTQKPLPKELFDKMIAAKNYQSGMQMLRQIEFALFDILLHSQDTPPKDVMPLMQQVRAEIAVIPSPEWARMPNTFSHIFAGGYAAGYYSYKWAEVLSADAYAAFEETASNGAHSKETGQRYRENILEVGGSRPAMESFIAFRGRKPSVDALLRHCGMQLN